MRASVIVPSFQSAATIRACLTGVLAQDLGTPFDVFVAESGNDGTAAYRRDTFWRAGAFPVGYFPQEDQIFHQRLLAIGARIRFDPSNVVTHAHRTNIGAFLAHQARIGAANARVVRALGLQGKTI